jgi:hypothetical protein
VVVLKSHADEWIVLTGEIDTCVRLLGATKVEDLGLRFVSFRP